MKLTIKNSVIVIMAFALLGMSYALYTTQTMISSGTSGVQGIGYSGMVCKKITRADGTVEDLGCDHNLLVFDGKNHTTSQLFSVPTAASATDIIDTMQLGNQTVETASGASIDPTNSTHSGLIAECGLAEATSISWRAVNNVTTQSDTGKFSNGNVTGNNQWTVTCSNGVAVNSTGLMTNGDVYFAGNSFSTVTLQFNDQLNVTWYVWIT